MKKIFYAILFIFFFADYSVASDCTTWAAGYMSVYNDTIIYKGHFATSAEAKGSLGNFSACDDAYNNNLLCGTCGLWWGYWYGDRKYATFGTCVDEVKYCILRTFSCPDGSPVGIEYTSCTDGVPDPVGDACGSVTWVQAFLEEIENETYSLDGSVTEHSCNCNYTYDQIMAMCARIEPGEDCDQPIYCIDDDDCDGVLNDDDLCPDTPYDVVVDEFGCPINIEDEWCCTDTDGDGVPDSEDACPNTAPGAVVDAYGCEIDNPQPDPDPDGGDQDNDNALLEGVIGWLKKIAGINSSIDHELSNANSELDRINEGVGDVKNINDDIRAMIDEFVNVDGVNSDIPAEGEYTSDMPEEEVPGIGDGENMMTGFLSDMLTNNPISQFVMGASLDTSGAVCSLSCPLNVLGSDSTLEFSLCEYESELQSFGAILMGITSLICFLIVFKR